MHSISKEFGLAFVVFCLQLFVLQGLVPFPRPPNCGRYECPPYSVIYTDTQYEIRAYLPANWITFPVVSSSFEDVKKKGFDQVFAYVNGQNRGRVKTGLSAPIIIDLGFATGSPLYKTYFYLPAKFQAKPPLPTSGSGQGVKLPPATYAAVRRFTGAITENVVKTQYGLLRNSLLGTPWQSATAVKPYSVAGYNAPFDPQPVNEVLIWFNNND